MKASLLILVGLVGVAHAQDSAYPPPPPPPIQVEKNDPASILNRVLTTYKSMASYQSVGTIVSNRDDGSTKVQTTTTFTIKLKKPHSYLITWSQTSIPAALPQGGAVWSDGTQPYLYLLMNNTYSKVNDDVSALGGANAISGGASDTIPSLFLPAFTDKGFALSRLQNPKLEKTDFIGGEDCYVISGPTNTSKKETFWISKSSNLILKHEKSLEPPEGGAVAPTLTEDTVEKALKALGEPVTDENKKKVWAMMQAANGTMTSSENNGDTSEMQMEITNPNFTDKDFQFTPPPGTTLTDSLGASPAETGQPPTPPSDSGTNGPTSH